MVFDELSFVSAHIRVSNQAAAAAARARGEWVAAVRADALRAGAGPVPSADLAAAVGGGGAGGGGSAHNAKRGGAAFMRKVSGTRVKWLTRSALWCNFVLTQLCLCLRLLLCIRQFARTQAFSNYLCGAQQWKRWGLED